MVGRRLDNLRHDARFYVLSLGVQFRAAATLRGAFAAQVFGMIFNNTALIAAWFFLFVHFGTINGWSGNELIALQGVNMLVFGIVMLASVGIMDLPRHVDQGSFDSFLTRPGSVLAQLGSSNVDATTIGDALLGLGLTIWYIVHAHASAAAIGMFLLVIVSGCVIAWCFMLLLPNMLAFYVYDSERLARYLGFLFLDTGLYPTGVLTGALRTGLLTVIPGLFMGAIEVDVLRGLHWWMAGLGAVVAAFWLTATLWLFHRSIRRYESANLVGAR